MVNQHVGHGIGHPLEVVETVLEVADVAWNAYEHHRHRQEREEELCLLRSENRRLRGLLADNLALLQGISEFPSFTKDCPPDLHSRLVRAVESSSFLNHLKALNQEPADSLCNGFPFKRVMGENSKTADIMVDVGCGEPSFWVWVTEEMVPGIVQEPSGIDNESYVIVGEEQVVDGIANFMARCIVANPKSRSVTPEELQKMGKALNDMNDWFKLKKAWHAGKLLYALSTWGIALAGLYTHRGLVKAAVKGVGTTGKLLLKAL
ncbi:unnamed protein product [Spirodela intermedia]|uniref:Uncharacterized protein n=1 Tax=Spirodela intermedia TaxID=51605 RepID=A0A7I8J661_SPIIN|nr:unnamed protein product [Spirodela intermedia]CAA6664932.1 unnamed protein product [Spirodela intermedia]